MNWLNKTWNKEDIEYAAKRKVNNKQSRYINHISGGFYSPKLKKDVGYESLWGECLFYYCLELDKLTIRYYDQPVEVPVFMFNEKKKEIRQWIHIPDVLVFRQGHSPHLFQIKGSDNDNENDAIARACQNYSKKRGWKYDKIYPKEIPEVIKNNILLLWNYIKPRKRTEYLVEEILHKMNFINEIRIIDLAMSFSAKVDFRFVLPVIYYLIANGELKVNFTQPISQFSTITNGSISIQIADYFITE
jgi:hypothetical protein